MTVAVTAGCPYAPPARTTGPTESAGVQMAIVSQYCEDSDEPDYQGFEAVQLRMRISVTNRGHASVAFDPDRIRLIAPDSVTPSPVAADSAMVVAPGETKVAAVRFMNRGSLKCKEEMKLDPSDSLVAGTKPVPLRPIGFIARNGS
jgi:hypothetical protein